MQTQLPVQPGNDVKLLTWPQWQRAVLSLLQADPSGLLRFIESDEIDWDSWRQFYVEGRSPQAAIDRALTRDF